MTVEILVPEMGESVLEATVTSWLKQEGDFVNVGDVLVELETDKVNLEVGAKSSGKLVNIKVKEGEDVKVGDVLGLIDEKVDEAAEAAPGKNAVREKELAQGNGRERERQTAPQVTPVASRLAREKGVDVSKLSGTGAEGRVTRADVEQFLQAEENVKETKEQAPAGKEAEVQSPQREVSSSRPEERIRMSRRRRTIAERLLEAQQTTAMLTTFNEIDMSAVMEIRKRRNEEFQKQHGIKLGFMSFFVKASIGALKAFPQVNAEIDGDEIVLKHFFDMGVAIGAEDGLVVPVLRDADRLSFAGIERQIKEYVTKTNEGKLSIEDLRGGTFTITNGGVFGSMLSTPILNPPQVGILGLHKIEDRPIAMNGRVVIRPMMYVALSYDHRIVDGREAVQFLVKVKELIEDPERLLLEG
ncbi:MAG: dihydrolipoyllysine-residue succinyltransferase [Anaerolineales bacterium]|nr:MAG: dihydrolipoyllysine-residue succinyltransferase [Anaerolineales bacterium]